MSNVCFAQQRITEIMNGYDPEKRSVFEGKSFDTGNGSSVDNKKARVKEFYFVDKIRNREFQTREFHGTKTSQFAAKSYSTRMANTNSGRVIPNLDKAYAVKEISPRTAYDADKTLNTRSYSGVREAHVKGKAQGAIDLENAPREPLSLEQVREVLNRSK